MPVPTTARLSLPFVVALATTLAMGQAPPRLVGLTATTPTLTHRDHGNCTTLAQCSPAGFPATTAAVPYHGGTGWDPVLSGAWISNGPTIACISDTCGYLCPPTPVPTPGAITGLEVVESLDEIWATDTLGNICRLSRACPPTLLSVCNTGLSTTPTVGLSGLAIDEGRQLVFFSHVDFAVGQSGIYVSTLANPCAPFLAIHPPAACTVLVGVTGLAVDWGNTTLYLTDGFTSASWNYSLAPGPTVTFGTFQCCTLNNGGEPLVGLAWRPQPPVPFGAPCANGSCATCPMVHSANGDPNLGNFQFAIDLAGVPAGSVVWCMVAIGTCAAPGQSVPPLCGPLWNLANAATPVLGTLGPNVVPGGGGCAPLTQFPLPLPSAPGLAGLPLATQCVAFCPAGGTGTSVSNCLSFVLQGN